MKYPATEFDLGLMDEISSDVDDSTLDLSEEIAGDFEPTYDDLVSGSNDIILDAPTAYGDEEAVNAKSAAKIERLLINMIATNRHGDVLSLVGETDQSLSKMSKEIRATFRDNYHRAVRYNKYIGLYSKIIKAVDPKKFTSIDGILSLKITASNFERLMKNFRSVADPYGATDDSPITTLISALFEKTGKASILKSQKLVSEASDIRSHNETGQMEMDQINFADPNVDGLTGGNERDIFGQKADIRLEENNFDLEEADLTNNPTINVSLNDLSNKAIAEYLVAKKIDSMHASDHLSSEGFSRSRMNEIVGIMKFINLNTNLEDLTPQGNRGAGNTDFPFDF